MKRFSIYILSEVLKIFLVALTAFTSISLLVVVIQQLMEQGLGLSAIYAILPYALPIALQYALPATMLFAVCSVYGRVSADNEIIALKGAGIAPIKVISPTLILGFLISPIAVWLNDLAVSWGEQGINKVVMHSIEEIAYRYLSTQGRYSYPNTFSIVVDGIKEDGRELVSPEITVNSFSPPLTISARTGSLRFNPATETLVARLVDCDITQGTRLTAHHPGSFDQAIPLGKGFHNSSSQLRPQQIALRDIGPETSQQLEALRKTKELLAARTAMALTAGRYDWLDDVATHNSLVDLQVGNDRMYRLNREPWRRWASGFSCFFFVWVGVPLAIWMRTADYSTCFGMCFLPTILIFYPFMQLGSDLAKDGSWPPCSVWLGNVILLAIGAWWLRKIHRN